jgi:hypothetical protein
MMNFLAVFIIYTFLCFLTATAAQKRGRDFWNSFTLGFLISPLFLVVDLFRK